MPIQTKYYYNQWTIWVLAFYLPHKYFLSNVIITWLINSQMALLFQGSNILRFWNSKD